MNTGNQKELREYLEEKSSAFNCPGFVMNDPIKVPRQFIEKENIEISAFLTATLAWGRREVIIRSSMDLMSRMDRDPYTFLLHMREEDLDVFAGFQHRTFTEEDCAYFIRALRNLYLNYGGLEGVFRKSYLASRCVKSAIIEFRRVFFELSHRERTRKHVADPGAGAAAKRMNMFLRWMVRKDHAGVDFGIWDFIPMSGLFLPLDVHTGTVARGLGLLNRRQNDWKAVEEVTAALRTLDADDPVKYDYALFGMGIQDLTF